MKVFCVNPPSVGAMFVREGRCMQRADSWSNLWMPISLAYTSSVLKEAGHEVLFRDCTAEKMGFQEMEEVMKAFGPEMVVINSSIPTLKEDLKVAEIAKKLDGNAITVLMGVAGKLGPVHDQTIRNEFLDVIVRGDAEFVVGALADSGGKLDGVRGISFKKNGKVVCNPDAEPLDLDKLPFADFQSMPLEAYYLPFNRKKICMIEESRGCPFDCIFCVAPLYYGKKVRVRSPEKVVDEIEFVYKKFGIDQFFFWADTFTLNRQNAIGICEEILKRQKEGRIGKIGWLANSRVDCADEELFGKMKEAGCWLVGFGVESLNQEVLKRSKKGTTPEQIEGAIGICRKVGIRSVAHVIFGLPGETKKTVRETVEGLKRIGPDYVNFYIAVPYPGTELHRICQERGYIVTDDLSRYEICNAVIETEHFTAAELEGLRKQAFREFYLRPKVVLNHVIRSVSRPKELQYLVEDGGRFLKGWMLKR